jgi:hypothetical protein
MRIYALGKALKRRTPGYIDSSLIEIGAFIELGKFS